MFSVKPRFKKIHHHSKWVMKNLCKFFKSFGDCILFTYANFDVDSTTSDMCECSVRVYSYRYEASPGVHGLETGCDTAAAVTEYFDVAGNGYYVVMPETDDDIVSEESSEVAEKVENGLRVWEDQISTPEQLPYQAFMGKLTRRHTI